MTDDIKVPAPLEALVRAVAGGTDDPSDDERAMTFARGLALGALVGAAIAGSTLWQRHLARRASRARFAAADATAPSGRPVDPGL